MKRDTRIVAAVLAGIGGAIAGAALLCSWALAHGAPAWFRAAFRVFCHGIPERSLAIFGEAMPICARCFGIYGGLIGGVAIFALWPWIEEGAARLLLFAAALPIGIDGVTQAIALRASTNPLRVTTGLMAAVAFAVWALAAVEHRREAAVRTS
ncbi:MAG TPA: DUF2085 domain-containing protein [Thermoanaerobaculia bacterium]|nr:DUF2085 domain-containing protein [Thermoanaerobaculia bacterium]